jgi:Uma2 family endonuclease
MSDRAKSDDVYQQFLATPEHKVAEIIDGRLIIQPRPGSWQALATVALLSALYRRFVDANAGGWVILKEPELHLARDILVPDIVGWQRERMPVMPDVAAFELAPDWICEVLSASTAGLDRAEKLPIYARHGVSHAWLVDPVAQTLEVLKRDGQQWLLLGTHRDQAMIRAEPFEALEWDLGTLWAR